MKIVISVEKRRRKHRESKAHRKREQPSQNPDSHHRERGTQGQLSGQLNQSTAGVGKTSPRSNGTISNLKISANHFKTEKRHRKFTI